MVRLLLITLMILLPIRAAAEPVIIFAAASLKGALDEIFTDQDVIISYGGSGAMAQQIAQGAPADIFLSANVAWADWVQEQGLGDERVDLLSNRLVTIANQEVFRDGIGPMTEAVSIGGLALGQTASVPVGIYARQSLEAVGTWDDMREHVIEFPSASAVLRAVELGEVPVGIVYFTDAAQSQRVATLDILPADTHEPIAYPALLLSARGTGIFAQLQGAEAAAVFRAHGFIVLEGP